MGVNNTDIIQENIHNDLTCRAGALLTALNRHYASEQHATLSERAVDWPTRSWIDEVLQAVDGNRERR